MRPRYMYTEELTALTWAVQRSAGLNRRQVSVLTMRADRLSTGLIGRNMGISRQRVHQIEKRAVEILEKEGLLDGSIYRTAGVARGLAKNGT